MKKCCGEDEVTQKILNKKLKKLEFSCEKVKNIHEEKNIIQKITLKERINRDKDDWKKSRNTNKSWIDELELENMTTR